MAEAPRLVSAGDADQEGEGTARTCTDRGASSEHWPAATKQFVEGVVLAWVWNRPIPERVGSLFERVALLILRSAVGTPFCKRLLFRGCVRRIGAKEKQRSHGCVIRVRRPDSKSLIVDSPPGTYQDRPHETQGGSVISTFQHQLQVDHPVETES